MEPWDPHEHLMNAETLTKTRIRDDGNRHPAETQEFKKIVHFTY